VFIFGENFGGNKLFSIRDIHDYRIEKLWSLILRKFDQKSWGFSKKLNPPTSMNNIEKIENQMNLMLPSELKKLYLLNNGEGEFPVGMFYGLGFISIEKMYYYWIINKNILERSDYQTIRKLNEFCTSTPERTIKKTAFNTKWIPIAEDWGGNYLAIDLDPDINGHIGQIINIGRDEDDKFVIAHSLYEYFVLLNSHLDKL
jgi:cell wall assembly regulator SMI1